MRTRWIVVLIAGLCSCHRASEPMPEPHAPASTAQLDALWAKAPAGATIGVVVSSRGLTMLEHAWHDVHGFLNTSPAFAPAEQEMATVLADSKLTTDLTLASLGLAPGKGFAFFIDAHERGLVLLPVADRDRFLVVVHGTRGKDADQIDDTTCKPLDGWYACADDPAMFVTLGKGELRHELAAVGSRGDIEAAVTAPVKGAAVVQLARGSVVVRGIFDGVPSRYIQKIGAPVHPRVDLEHDVGFAALDLTPLVADLPPVPIIDGVTVADLGSSVVGPLTASATAGAVIDLRIPLKDTAPAATLIAHCTSIPVFARLTTKLEHGACHVSFPRLHRGLDIWIDGKDLRIGIEAGGPAASPVPVSDVAKELASGSWQLALWGHGTVLAPVLVPSFVRHLPLEADLAMRIVAMVNEIGLGVARDGDRLRVVAALRTAWANPDEVVAKLQAVAPADLLAGKGEALGKVIADASPHAPFAVDYRAGTSGFVPVVLVGGTAGLLAYRAYGPARESRSPRGDRLAAMVVRKYAFEAYPQWAAAHPNQACPAALGELDAYVDGLVTPDPWGHPYQMACGANLPPGAVGLAVWSVGPDGQTGTADDVTSWQ